MSLPELNQRLLSALHTMAEVLRDSYSVLLPYVLNAGQQWGPSLATSTDGALTPKIDDLRSTYPYSAHLSYMIDFADSHSLLTC